MEQIENARVMKLTDLNEAPPPPPPPPPPNAAPVPVVEEIAETMIETDVVPLQTVVAAGTITTPPVPIPAVIAEIEAVAPAEDDYLPMHKLSSPPHFEASSIAADLVYPPIALRSGIEGRVILELFVDRTGKVTRITILREEPANRGFGEAAVRAFTDRKGIPAISNGEPVSARYRYPVAFKIK